MIMVQLSKPESELANLRILRGEKYLDTLDVKSFRDTLFYHHADLCKIKLNADDDALFNVLDSLKLPYFISSIVFRNETVVNREHGDFEFPPYLTKEIYDGSQREELLSLINAVAKEPAGLYYRNELINQILTAEIEKKINIAYILSFNNKTDPEKYAWLLRLHNEPIGYFMGFSREKTFEGALYAIHPSFRGRGLARIVYQMMLKICAEKGYERFENAVHVLNYRSLSPTIQQGVLPQNMYFFVTVYPLITYAEHTCEGVVEVRADNIFDQICKISHDSQPDLQWHFFDKKSKTDLVQLTISSPIRTKKSSMQIIIAKKQENICGYGVINFS